MAVRGEGQREPPPGVAAREVDAAPGGSVRSGGAGINLGFLTAIGAVIASVTYVLLNSAYLEFYENLGIRPEDVGLDRLAILGRTFGLVLIALLMYVLFIAFFVARWLSEDTRRRRRLMTPERLDRTLRWRLVMPAVAIFVAVGVLSLAVTSATAAAGRRAERVEAGIPIGPLRVGPVLLIDVNAAAARAYWLDKDLPPPQLLDDPWLLYLGRSDRVAVFMACGTTVLVPADKVIPEILTTRDNSLALRGDAAQRKAVCAGLRH